jgi:hypothetical protein
VIDSGVGSGIEKFCLRKNVPLIGVCPEKEIAYPKINPVKRKENELTNGHTHFFLIGDEPSKKVFSWGQEAKLKFEIAKRIAKGRLKKGNGYVCKIVTIFLGDNQAAVTELEEAEESLIPVIFLAGSALCNDVVMSKGGFPGEPKTDQDGDGQVDEAANKADGKIQNPTLAKFVQNDKFFLCKSNSEDIANITHLALTLTLLDLKKPVAPEPVEGGGEL